MKKIIIVLLIIAIAIATYVGVWFANQPITDERDLEFEIFYCNTSLTYVTQTGVRREWYEVKPGYVFIVVQFKVKNNGSKSQQVTQHFTLHTKGAERVFQDKAERTQNAIFQCLVEAESVIYADSCFEVPEELAESEFLIEHNGQQWQIPPMKWGSN